MNRKLLTLLTAAALVAALAACGENNPGGKQTTDTAPPASLTEGGRYEGLKSIRLSDVTDRGDLADDRDNRDDPARNHRARSAARGEGRHALHQESH